MIIYGDRDDGGCPIKKSSADSEEKKWTHPSDALGYFVAYEYPVHVGIAAA